MLPDAFINRLEFRVLYKSSHLILDCYWLHLTDEETEAQGG